MSPSFYIITRFFLALNDNMNGWPYSKLSFSHQEKSITRKNKCDKKLYSEVQVFFLFVMRLQHGNNQTFGNYIFSYLIIKNIIINILDSPETCKSPNQRRLSATAKDVQKQEIDKNNYIFTVHHF